jgi:hypothetical protein
MRTLTFESLSLKLSAIALITVIGAGSAPATVTLQIMSQNYPTDYNIDEPWGGDAGEGGYWSSTVLDNTYTFSAYAFAEGNMKPTWPWEYYHGAGGHRTWGYDLELALYGEPGEEADVYVDVDWYGNAWVDMGGFTVGSATARSSYQSVISDPTQEILSLWDQWELSIDTFTNNPYDTGDSDSFGSYPDPFYLGRMAVGDSFSLEGYLHSNANAYAGGPGTFYARMQATLQVAVTAQDVRPTTVPAPSAILLSGIGLAGLGGLRRRLRNLGKGRDRSP